MRALAALVLLARTVLAQDDLPFDPMVIAQCLATGFAQTCIGMAADVCITDAGPMSDGLCKGRETAWWRARAEAAMTALRVIEPEVSARAARLGWPDPPPSMDAVAAGFAAYRDAACGWRGAQWDGIHAAFEGADCEMRLTAQHALWLEQQARTIE